MSMGLKKTSSGLRTTTSSRALGSRDADKKLTSHTLGQVLHELGVDEIEDELSDSSDEEGPRDNLGSVYHHSQFQLQKQVQQQKQKNAHNSSQQKLQTKISFNGFEENTPMIRIPSQHTLRPPSMQNLLQVEQRVASPPPQAPQRQPSPVVKVILPRRLSHQEMQLEAAAPPSLVQPYSDAQYIGYRNLHGVHGHAQETAAFHNDALVDGERRRHNDERHSHTTSHIPQRYVSPAPQQYQYPGQQHHFHDEYSGRAHFGDNAADRNPRVFHHTAGDVTVAYPNPLPVHYDEPPTQNIGQGRHVQEYNEDSHQRNNDHQRHPNHNGNQSHHDQAYHDGHQSHHGHQGHYHGGHQSHHGQAHHGGHQSHHDQAHHDGHQSHHGHQSHYHDGHQGHHGHQSHHDQAHHDGHQTHQSRPTQQLPTASGGKHATVPFEENPMLRLKKKPSLASMNPTERAQPSPSPSQASPRKAFVDPAAVVAEAAGSAAAVLKDFDPRLLPEEEQVKLSLRLTKQASKYGTNMFEELRDVDRSEIETLESFGFAFNDAVERIFTERTDVVVTEVIRDATADEGALVSEPALTQVDDERQKQHVRRQSLSASVSMIDNPLRRKPSGIPPIEQILADSPSLARQLSLPGGVGSADDGTADTTTTSGSASTAAMVRRASAASDSQAGDFYASSASLSSGSSLPPPLSQPPNEVSLSVQVPSSRPLSRSTSFQSTQSDGAPFAEPPSPSSYAANQRPTSLGQATGLAGLASPERPGLSPRQNSGGSVSSGLPPAGHHRRTSSGASASSIPPLPPRSSSNSVTSHRSPSPFVDSAAYDSYGAYRQPSSPSPPPLPPRQASPAPTAYGYAYGYGGPSAGYGSGYGSGYGAQSSPSPPPVASRRSSAPPAQLVQQMRVDALSRLSESEQLRVSMLLSKQDERFGANMFDSLSGADLPELDHWLCRGFGFEQTALFMFQRKRGAAVGDAPQS